MKRGGPLKRTPMRRRYKATGFDRATVARAIDRDQRCVLCGLVSDPRDLTGHHRRNRGSGGSSDPAANSLTNCLAVCWPCNGLMESSWQVAAEARDRRIKLASWEDPATTPVQYLDGCWYELDALGQRWLIPDWDAA